MMGRGSRRCAMSAAPAFGAALEAAPVIPTHPHRDANVTTTTTMTHYHTLLDGRLVGRRHRRHGLLDRGQARFVGGVDLGELVLELGDRRVCEYPGRGAHTRPCFFQLVHVGSLRWSMTWPPPASAVGAERSPAAGTVGLRGP